MYFCQFSFNFNFRSISMFLTYIEDVDRQPGALTRDILKSALSYSNTYCLLLQKAKSGAETAIQQRPITNKNLEQS